MKRNSLPRGVSIYGHILFTTNLNIRKKKKKKKLRWKNSGTIWRFDCTSTNSRPNVKYVTSLKIDKFAFRNWFLILPYRSVIASFSLPSSFMVFGVYWFLSFLPSPNPLSFLMLYFRPPVFTHCSQMHCHSNFSNINQLLVSYALLPTSHLSLKSICLVIVTRVYVMIICYRVYQVYSFVPVTNGP